MLSRFSSAVFLSLFVVSAVAGQTVRFDTNVGTFDLELNPTGNADLQPLVDNMLAYVNDGRYDQTVINRAATGFVMQMGGFKAETLVIPSSFSNFNPVEKFAPVIVDADNDRQVDFDLTGLNNTRSTVSLALSSSANTGTSSFFINLGSNASLDSPSMRFVPFAVVSDMATIDLIMSLDQNNYADGGLAGDNVPILSDNRMVFVERAYEVTDSPLLAALAAPSFGSGTGGSGLSGSGSGGLQSGLSITGVPEPSTLVLAAAALMLMLTSRRLQI
ncbi:MAG: PEP-CTERM sorting domain-containing protein [Planctomycetes bacterium]|nr:PEP-CTERM sorting domain-containing protein [Planctomycetota bacterium]